MSQPALRLYVDQPLVAGGEVVLSQPQVHYLAHVMRRDVGAALLLFNGQEGEWSASVAELRKKQGLAVVANQVRAQKASPDLMLVFAPVKRGPLDQIAQKASELGVACLQPVQSARTIVSRLREDRLTANAVEAAEQSERLDVAQVRPLVKLETLIARWPQQEPKRQLMFCDEAGEVPEQHWGGVTARAHPVLMALAPYQTKDKQPWAILIGPEGGFTPAERKLLRAQDFVVPVTLGPRILRADTAAFAAITLWQAALGDFTSA